MAPGGALHYLIVASSAPSLGPTPLMILMAQIRDLVLLFILHSGLTPLARRFVRHSAQRGGISSLMMCMCGGCLLERVESTSGYNMA